MLGNPTAQAGRLPKFNVVFVAATDIVSSGRHLSQSILQYSMTANPEAQTIG